MEVARDPAEPQAGCARELEEDEPLYMNLLTVLYVILVIVGIAWVMYRLRTYISQQRERESRWDEMAADDEFRSYVKDLRETTSTSNQGKKQKSRKENFRPPLSHPVRNRKDGGANRKD
jgi:hypothetical protein